SALKVARGCRVGLLVAGWSFSALHRCRQQPRCSLAAATRGRSQTHAFPARQLQLQAGPHISRQPVRGIRFRGVWRDEVYVREFPSGEARWVVSIDGGTRPVWGRDGRELFYISSQRLLAVPVETAASLRIGRPQQMFTLPRDADNYEVTQD